MNRPLVLSGFMGTGKSAVGQALAQRIGARWVDLDQQTESVCGVSIADFFADKGEAEFRKLESETLRGLLREADSPLVISAGGGALVDSELRIDVLSQAVVVTLEASPQEIVRRVRAQDGDSGARPLLAGGDPEVRVEQLLDARRIPYLEAHGRVTTDGRSVEEISGEVEDIWRSDCVAVAAGEKSYVVRIGSGIIRPHLGALVGAPSGTLLVTDENVNPLHGEKARSVLTQLGGKKAEVVLRPGEEHKNLTGLSGIFQAAFDGNMDRKATFVGLGGGVVTDMTGFAAASWVRGVRWIGCPTTLLAMVDASVGGKTGVDFHTAKNSVGAFWQPAGVLCDVDTLQTETDRMYVGAISEAIKTALIGDADLVTFLEENAEKLLARDPATVTEVVDRCVRVKARVVALDEREGGVRATLNLGHTIGHALESSGGYTALTHGEAVSLGLVAALRVGERRGHTPKRLTGRVLALLKRLGLPHVLKREDLEKSTALIGLDKKRAGESVRFAYAREEGDVFMESIALQELESLAPDLADD